MSGFIRAELYSRRRMIAGLAAGSFSLLLIVALSYKSLGEGALATAFHGHAPRGLTALAGSAHGDVFAPHGWMAFGFNHPLFLTLTLTASVAVGSGAIAGEIGSGRGELLFSAPLERTRFLWSALAVWLAAELAVVGAAAVGALVGAAFTGSIRRAGVAALLWAPLQYLPVALFFVALACLGSGLASTAGRAVGTAVAAAVLSYLLTVVSGLLPALDWLRWLSPFGYYDPAGAIARGPDIAHMAILVAASALMLWIAAGGLRRRDLA